MSMRANRHRLRAVGLMCLVVVLLAGCRRPPEDRAGEKGEDAPPDAAAVEALIRRSGRYDISRHVNVEHSTYLDDQQAEVYRELERLGYIKIEGETEEFKHRAAPGVDVLVSLTEKGAAVPGLKTRQSGWGFPIAEERVYSITPAGRAPGYMRAFHYKVEYGWELNDLGRRLESVLPAARKPPAGRLQEDTYVWRTREGLTLVNPQ
jgi:hypothetical protein